MKREDEDYTIIKMSSYPDFGTVDLPELTEEEKRIEEEVKKWRNSEKIKKYDEEDYEEHVFSDEEEDDEDIDDEYIDQDDIDDVDDEEDDEE